MPLIVLQSTKPTPLRGLFSPPIPPIDQHQGDHMATKTKEISTRVTEDVKAKFINMANNKGLTESELLRLIISEAIINQEEKRTTPKIEMVAFSHMRKTEEDELKITRLEIHLPKFLIVAAKEKAKTQGMATSRWIKSLVQTNLIQTPVLIDSALMAVKESNRELAAVGNNLNQIARRLNESVFKIEMVRIEKLEEVNSAVKSLRVELKKLIRVSQDAWGVE